MMQQSDILLQKFIWKTPLIYLFSAIDRHRLSRDIKKLEKLFNLIITFYRLLNHWQLKA